MTRFQRGNDAFKAAQRVKRGDGFVVVDRDILRAADVLQQTMFRPDTGIIQSGRNRMRLDDLAVLVLHQIDLIAVQYADLRVRGERRGMLTAGNAVSARFHADDLHVGYFDVRMKKTDRIRASAHTGDYRIRLTTYHLWHLHAGFVADDALKIAHHHRIRMRACRRTENVERVFDVGDPIAYRFVARVFERLGTAFYRHDGRAQQLHAEHIRCLALYVFRAHIHDAFHAETRRHRRGRHAVHARAGLGDDALFAHAFCQQCLTHRAVDLVRTGMIQIFAFQIDLRAAQMFGQTFGVINGAGTTNIMLQLIRQLGFEFGIVLIAQILHRQFCHGGNQGLRHISAAELAEVTCQVGKVITHCA